MIFHWKVFAERAGGSNPPGETRTHPELMEKKADQISMLWEKSNFFRVTNSGW